MTITLKDENIAGKILNHILIQVEKDTCTLQEIITERVKAEVNKYNEAIGPRYFNGLVQPSESEVTLNGYRVNDSRKISVQRQVDTALKAFKSNGFFVLVDKKQVTDLDQKIELHSERNISFIRLTQLVGG